MIHILTVHWHDERWIDIQLDYFNKNINSPFKVYAFLNFLPGDHSNKYFYSSTENIESHPIKLNLLADMASLHSTDENDWLMFIDGDALIIDDVVSFGKEKLKKFPLVAIQRKENSGDMQPHPSFCLTTIKFWNEIKGDWKDGYCWENSLGKWTTDVGGNLLSILRDKKIDWFPLLRSNKINLHPIWFGIYNDLIYHHGAGFRNPISRIDVQANKYVYFMRKLCSRLPNYIGNRITPVAKIEDKNRRLMEIVYKKILNDPYFYLSFMEPELFEKNFDKSSLV